MTNHHINRRMYSTNVRAFSIKRKAVESLITILWHLAPAFTLQLTWAAGPHKHATY